MLKGGIRKNMKRRLKIIPSVLLLVLCLGILGVGIYAAKPASNTISGTVTVNAANARVLVDTYLEEIGNGNKIATQLDTRTVGTIEFNQALSFVRNSAYVKSGQTTSLEYADFIYEVDDMNIIFGIQNTSTTTDLGVYFSNSSQIKQLDVVYAEAKAASEEVAEEDK